MRERVTQAIGLGGHCLGYRVDAQF